MRKGPGVLKIENSAISVKERGFVSLQWSQHFAKIDQEKRKVEQICILNPMTTGFIM